MYHFISYVKKHGIKRQPTSNFQQQHKCPSQSSVAIKDSDASIVRELNNINSCNPRGVSAFDVSVNDVLIRQAQPKSAPSTNSIKKKESKRKRRAFSIDKASAFTKKQQLPQTESFGIPNTNKSYISIMLSTYCARINIPMNKRGCIHTNNKFCKQSLFPHYYSCHKCYKRVQRGDKTLFQVMRLVKDKDLVRYWKTNWTMSM